MTKAADFIHAFLTSIEAGNMDVGEWYAPDAVQIEWPNKLAPGGAVRDLDGLRAAAERGRKIVERQWYEVSNLVEQDGRIAVEAIFRATFKIDLPDLLVGDVMEARFAMFFELAGGKICRHTTYDCFMPGSAG